MRLEELKAHYGTWTKMNIKLELGPYSYQYWRKRGYIPYPAQLVIEKKTNGLFKASLDDAVPEK